MTHPIYIRHATWMYEIHVRDASILRITRYGESSEGGESQSWDDLDEEVQDKILSRMRRDEEPEDFEI